MEVDVCIVGAGPVGGTLACRLAQGGARVAVIDRAALPPMEHPDFDGRAYAIAAGSRRLLEAAGLWNALPQPSGPILDIRVSDGRIGRRASPLHLHFDHTHAAPPGEATPFGWMVEARSLRVALNATLHTLPGLHLFAPAEAIVHRGEDHATVTVANGPTITARLVVAAEGRNSPLRDQAGIPVTRAAYGQRGIVCAIAHEKPHHGLALEHFLPSGPFAQLPMAPSAGEPNLSAIVWTERTATADRIAAMNDAQFTREVARRLGSQLGAIRLVGRRWTYPLGAMHAQRYTSTRLALIGDAAHGIHPIAGQGLNLGFRDIMALSDLVLSALDAGQDPGTPAILAAYQRRRRPDNLAMLAATDALDRLFSTNNPLLRTARDLGIAAVDRLPTLKKVFMRAAMGA
jgi:2-octaprenyl-6-methoxyphenol hydroxylase